MDTQFFFQLTLDFLASGNNIKMSVCIFPDVSASPVTKRFCARNWQTGGSRFNSRSPLSTQPFGVFRSFHRNSRKYGLGYLTKILTESTPTSGPGPTSGQLILILQLNQMFRLMQHLRGRVVSDLWSVPFMIIEELVEFAFSSGRCRH